MTNFHHLSDDVLVETYDKACAAEAGFTIDKLENEFLRRLYDLGNREVYMRMEQVDEKYFGKHTYNQKQLDDPCARGKRLWGEVTARP